MADAVHFKEGFALQKSMLQSIRCAYALKGAAGFESAVPVRQMRLAIFVGLKYAVPQRRKVVVVVD